MNWLARLRGPAPLITPKLESPIEQDFWQAYVADRPRALEGLVTQHVIKTEAGPARVDFALPKIKVAIELDGWRWHSSEESFVADRRRDRQLGHKGWRVIRFAGTEVYHDAHLCVAQAAQLAEDWS